jgi:DNA-binding response OmpR family regulator
MRSAAGDGLGEAPLLVADDEQTILEPLSGSLRFAGFEVMTAASPCVSYPRRKVDQGEPRLIHTVRGVGYVLRIRPP